MADSDRDSSFGALRRLAVLGTLHDDQVRRLAGIVQRRDFSEGDQLYTEGDVGADFMFVGQGSVEARRRTPFGDQMVAALKESDLVGEISLLDHKPRSSSIVALTDGFMWRFSATAIAELVEADPDFELGLLRLFCRSLAGKIRQANQVMSQIMAPDGPAAAPRPTRSNGTSGEVDDATRRSLLEDHGLDPAEFDTLSEFAEAQRFASGEHIFSEGDPCDTLYLIAEGEVRISRHIPGLGDEALTILEAGEVFGELAWLDRSPRSADAIAHVGGCTVLAVDRDQLDGTLADSTTARARFLRTLSTVLCRRLRAMNDQLVAYRTIAWF
jgi:CRP/FNR family cyclic AMP-dependent transcriptional regulator